MNGEESQPKPVKRLRRLKKRAVVIADEEAEVREQKIE